MGENTKYECSCSSLLNASKDGVSQIYDCSSDVYLIEGTGALIDMLCRKRVTHVCKTVWNKIDSSGAIQLLPKKHCYTGKKDHTDSDAKVHVILHPKRVNETKRFKPGKFLARSSNRNYFKYSENIHGRRVCAKGLPKNGTRKINDNVVQNYIRSDTDDGNFGTDVEWMSIQSIIKLMSSLSNVANQKNSHVTADNVKPVKKIIRPKRKSP